MRAYHSSFRTAKSNGFTLIEMMIVVAIISILSAIAIPQYSQYQVKAINAAAQAFLLDVTQREEQYFLDARSYATGANAIATLGMTVPDKVSSNYQAPQISATASGGFQAVLAPVSGGRMDGSAIYQGTLVITNTNPTASTS